MHIRESRVAYIHTNTHTYTDHYGLLSYQYCAVLVGPDLKEYSTQVTTTTVQVRTGSSQ